MSTTIGQHGLPSPIISASSPALSNASTTGGRSGLPTPRRHSLKPGSPKEIALINYLDDKVLRITRRYGKKFAEPDSASEDAPGYTSLEQAIVDLDPLVDLAWASGTPAIQIPYLLSFAGLVASYMSAFAFTKNVFQIVKKIDQAFTLLLREDSNEATRSHPVSTTEKVRIKSLVEETRLIAVHVATSSRLSTETEDDSDEDDNETTALAISRMYKSTIEILGDALV